MGIIESGARPETPAQGSVGTSLMALKLKDLLPSYALNGAQAARFLLNGR
jgi:hypothetical protein